jgi:hypothetical protein
LPLHEQIKLSSPYLPALYRGLHESVIRGALGGVEHFVKQVRIIGFNYAISYNQLSEKEEIPNSVIDLLKPSMISIKLLQEAVEEAMIPILAQIMLKHDIALPSKVRNPARNLTHVSELIRQSFEPEDGTQNCSSQNADPPLEMECSQI